MRLAEGRGEVVILIDSLSHIESMAMKLPWYQFEPIHEAGNVCFDLIPSIESGYIHYYMKTSRTSKV